ncbi:ganglioside-induced differentiation-associated protein 1 isoform X2 [Lingula anatina]|nr:ganglioside-induced differentiation-associated protein 1 isoform X2 [Lingula anatina]|eukprot:XP_013380307.1 ganglioside-induced differentiation-associated protein 1 isoform X2 [Lingula anatina]
MMDYLEKEFDTPPKLALADQNKTEQKKYQQMREKMQNLRMDIIFFGCMKYPELTSGMQFSPREMKWFMELQGNKSRALQKCEKKYPSLRQHYITSLDKIKHLDKEWEDKVRVMERLEDVEAILDQVERQLVTQNGTGDTYLFGKQFTIGDIDLIILLQQLDVLSLSERFWEGGTRPKLAAYYNRVKNRPSLKVAVEVNLMKHILYPKIRRNAGFLIGSVVLLTAVAVGAWWYTRS